VNDLDFFSLENLRLVYKKELALAKAFEATRVVQVLAAGVAVLSDEEA
jgi:hypothetical protein